MSLGPYDYKSVDAILARLKSMSLTKQQAEEIIELESVEITLGSVHPFPLIHRGDAPGPEFAFAVSSRVGRHSQAIAFVEDLELLFFARHSINFKVYVSESLP